VLGKFLIDSVIILMAHLLTYFWCVQPYNTLCFICIYLLSRLL